MKTASRNLSPLIPFIGRDDILTQYNDKLSRVLKYQGAVLAVIGPPGIGKTRLLQQFLKLTDSNSFFTFSLSLEAHTSLNDLFRQMLLVFLSRPAINNIIPAVINEELYTIAVQYFPVMKTLYPYEPLSKDKREITPETIYQFLKNLSHFHPIVITIDNFHFGDFEIKNFINLLIKNIEFLPVLLVLGLRPDETKISWLSSLKSNFPVVMIELVSLSTDEVLLLNKRLFGGDLPKKIFNWIYDKTKGYPLWVEEFLRFLLNQGVIYFDNNTQTWQLNKLIKNLPIPDTLTQMVEEKLIKFSDKAKKFIRAASLISTEKFDIKMINVPISSKDLDELENSDLLIKDGVRYSFTHELIKEIIYQTIPQRKQKHLHCALGNYLLKNRIDEEAVIQYSKSGRRDEVFLKLLIKETMIYHKRKEAARALFFGDLALGMFKQNPNLIRPKKVAFIIDSANSLRRIGRFKDAIFYYQLALNYIKNNQTKQLLQLIPFIYYSQTLAELRLGNYRKVINLANRAKKIAGEYKLLIMPSILLGLETNQALAYKDLGITKKALKMALNLEEKYKNQADPKNMFRLNNCIALIYSGFGKYQLAIKWCEKTLQLAEKLRNERYIAAIQGNLGIANLFVGNFQRAEELFFLHQKASVKNGWMREEFMSYLNLGTLYFFRGYLNRAEDEYRRAAKIIGRLKIKIDYLWLCYYYCWLLLFKDERERAGELLNQGIVIARANNNKNLLRMFHYLQAFFLILNNETKDLDKILTLLKNDNAAKIENEPEYLLLAGFKKLINRNRLDLSSSKETNLGFDDIEKGLKLIKQKPDNIKLVQYLIICSKFFSNQIKLKQISQEYTNTAIACALKNDMPGWADLLLPTKMHITGVPLKIKTFGKLTVETPDHRIVEQKEWAWAKPKQLFAILINAFINSQELTRDQIGFHLWPDLPREKLTNNFHVCLNQLKSVIGAEYIHYQERCYKLTNIEIDALIFRQLIYDAEGLLNAGKVHAAENNLTTTIKIYQGRYLEDFYEDWVFEMRDIFSSLYRRAIFMLGDIYLKKSLIYSAIEQVVKLILMDPLDEEAHRFLIVCYIQAGEKAKAIRQFKKCAEIFKRELNCEPSEKTQRLYRNLIG